MYHPINKFDCRPLQKFNDLVHLLLAFGLEQKLNQSEDGVKPLFVEYFGDNGYPHAGAWLWGKPVVIRRPVLKLAAIPLAEKLGILAAFEADSVLEDRFADGYFHAPSIPLGSRAALNLANTIIQSCYSRILASEGVPAEVIGEVTRLDRQLILWAYLDVQRPLRLKVCPGCDGLPPSRADGMIHEDLDHIFPKSKYPFLAVHPLNLTPFCKHCNQTYKRDKDAIGDDDASVADVRCLHDIFHPYLRPARNEIEVLVERDAASGNVHFKLRPKQNDPQHIARLHSLLYTLNVESRWTGDLLEERIEEKLEGLLLYGSEDERDGIDFKPGDDWLQAKLRTGLFYFERGIGRMEGFVPAYAYVQWVTSDEQARGEWLRRVKTAIQH